MKPPFSGATLLLLGLAGLIGAIALLWLTNLGGVSHWFGSVHQLQRQTAGWLEIPSPNAAWVLCLVMLLSVQIVIRLSPQPRVWSRSLVVAILLALVIRYVVWRSLTTLNLSSPVDGMVSIGLFGMEMLVMVSYAVQVFLMVQERDRRREADHYAAAVEAEEFLPTVAIFIPTFNEPAPILKRTVIGCQALDYPHKQVYLLDDGKREEIRQLADELGCNYIARPYNRHAKAGNLNYAIAHTSSDLIAVFDADFIPTKNFLRRTVGFFQNRTIGLVQTHQCFYNTDPPAHNLGLENDLTHEVEIFSRHYQLVRDGADSSLCYGSSFVARRSALEEAGGFITNTLSEDYFTGIRLSALGYQVIYLDEHLSAGLVPEDMFAHIAQRQRWARGTLQAFFIKANPLTIPGLTLRQRIAHLEGISQWFTSLCRVGFLIIPIATVFLGIVPVIGTPADWAYYFLPLYLVQFSTFAWLNHRSRSALISDVYSIIQCFPLSLTILQTLISPFSKGFWVTPKGTVNDRINFRWQLALPLIILWCFTLGCLLWEGYVLLFASHTLSLETAHYWKLGLLWFIFNLLVLSIAILSFVDLPKPDVYARLKRQLPVCLQFADQELNTVSVHLSEVGMEVAVSLNPLLLDNLEVARTPVVVSFLDASLALEARVKQFHFDRSTVQLAFEPMSLEQHRRLIDILFCTPGQWLRQKAPGELRTLWLLIRSIIYPRVLQQRHLRSRFVDSLYFQ